MKHLKQVSPGLNVYTAAFDSHLLDKLRTAFNTHLRQGLSEEQNAHLLAGGKSINIDVTYQKYNYHVESYGQAPLLWVSNNNLRTYNLFKSFLKSLDIIDDIKTLVDFEKHIRMYCGFFVIGNKMDVQTWHVDYMPGANAYTLITPLFEPDESHGNLIYRDQDKNVKTLKYKMNEAVIFGDHFQHATEPYEKSDKLRVMVSLTMGTDKLEHWEILKQTIGAQSSFMILPCGHQRGTCNCLDKFNV